MNNMTTKAPDTKSIEKISKALGDRHRLSILQHITRKGGCAQCAEIHDIVDLAQPSISHHMKILSEAGLIEAEKEGRHFKYTLNTSVLDQYMKFLQKLKNP
jgi:ArsR family transcriptional regulator, arsenate/arsenite/antimonite-responsive transcriptional repressor